MAAKLSKAFETVQKPINLSFSHLKLIQNLYFWNVWCCAERVDSQMAPTIVWADTRLYRAPKRTMFGSGHYWGDWIPTSSVSTLMLHVVPRTAAISAPSRLTQAITVLITFYKKSRSELVILQRTNSSLVSPNNMLCLLMMTVMIWSALDREQKSPCQWVHMESLD